MVNAEQDTWNLRQHNDQRLISKIEEWENLKIEMNAKVTNPLGNPPAYNNSDFFITYLVSD